MMTTNIRYNSIYFFLKYLYIWIIVTIKLHLIIELIQPLKGLNMPMSVTEPSYIISKPQTSADIRSISI